MHALITGGTKGIGLKTTQRFLEAGWQVTVLARNASQLQLDCAKYDIDLTDIAGIKKLPTLIGEIDALINNAGMMNTEAFDSYGRTKKDAIIKLNLEAPIELMSVFGESLRERDGRIVNVGSIAGEIGHPDIWYGATKAGLMNATKSFAKLLGPDVSVNAIAPGPVETDMVQKIPAERLTAMKKNAATGRIATPDEIADLIFWLATAAPKQITGSIVDINGGAYMR